MTANGASPLTGEEALQAILLWTINDDAPTPVIAEFDEVMLMKLAAYHRLTARLFVRLDAARPAWCRIGLLTRFRAHQFQVREQIKRQLGYARAINDAVVAAGDPPPIWVKGFSGYALTNRVHNLHQSGDMDPFVSNLQGLWDVCIALGYAGKRKYTHEWAKMRLPHSDVIVDIHGWFPTLQYPAGVRDATEAELSTTEHPGHWRMPFLGENDKLFVGFSITWDDLSPDSVAGTAPGTEMLRFPSPTFACLIHCAHVLRNILTHLHFLNPIGGVRLQELMTIADLARLPAFDPARFVSLVAEFRVEDSVRAVNRLARAYLGRNLLPRDSGDWRDEYLFPEHLHYGGWIAMITEHDFLFPRSVKSLITQLGANLLPGHFTGDVTELPRLLMHGTDPPLPHLTMTRNPARDELRFVWRLPAARVETEAQFEAHFGVDSFVRVLIRRMQVVDVERKSDYYRSDQREGELVQITQEPDGWCRVAITCPVPALPESILGRGATTLPLLLSVRTTAPQGDSVCYIPMQLTDEPTPER